MLSVVMSKLSVDTNLHTFFQYRFICLGLLK